MFCLAASAGILLGCRKFFLIRRRRRVHLPALTTEKASPYDARQNILPPGPWQSGMKKQGVASFASALTYPGQFPTIPFNLGSGI